MTNKPQGSLYYVIPAEVMHDRSLDLEQKVLYALISGLSNTYGYCFASNQWFEKEMGIKEKALQRQLKSLESKGYILRKITSDEKNPFKKERHIYICASFKKCLPGVKNDALDTEDSDASVPSNMTGILSEAKELISEEKKDGGKPPPPPSADAEGLFEFFLSKIKERSPKFKDPNKKVWTEDFDKLLRIDKRDLEECKEIIEWAAGQSFWKANCLSPSTLRKSYDKMLLQMDAEEDQKRIDSNRKFALILKNQYPDRVKNLTINPKYAMNLAKGKELPFDLPRETFKNALCEMFGARYEPNRQN